MTTCELRLTSYSVCHFRSTPHIFLPSAQNFSSVTGERPLGLIQLGVVKAQPKCARELILPGVTFNLLVTAPVHGASEDNSLCYFQGSQVPPSTAVTLITHLVLVFFFPCLMTPSSASKTHGHLLHILPAYKSLLRALLFKVTIHTCGAASPSPEAKPSESEGSIASSGRH